MGVIFLDWQLIRFLVLLYAYIWEVWKILEWQRNCEMLYHFLIYVWYFQLLILPYLIQNVVKNYPHITIFLSFCYKSCCMLFLLKKKKKKNTIWGVSRHSYNLFCCSQAYSNWHTQIMVFFTINQMFAWPLSFQPIVHFQCQMSWTHLKIKTISINNIVNNNPVPSPAQKGVFYTIKTSLSDQVKCSNTRIIFKKILKYPYYQKYFKITKTYLLCL